MKNKLLAMIFSVCVLVVALGAFNVFAATEGIYTYTVSNRKATITDCSTSASGEIVIPDTLGGYPVTRIGTSAFDDCSGLTSVTIPNSVTSIGDNAFYECTSLTSITIPDSVTSIGNYVFYGCTELTSITIPDSVTSIGNYVFYGCTSLTSATIGDNVTKIGDYAFYRCTGLTSLTIGKSVTSIGIAAFYGCTGLTNIIIPSKVANIGKDAFNNCSGLKSINIPNGIKTISGSVFYNCTSLQSITIPSSVTEIGSYAFYSCVSLTSITIPNSVTEIGSSAFGKCFNLAQITWNAKNVADCSSEYSVFGGSGANSEHTSVVFGEEVEKIPSYAFYDSRITNVTISDSVTNIGSRAFAKCTQLETIAIGNNVTALGEYAFYGCTNLTSVVIPEGITEIPQFIFAGCTALTRISIPECVTRIGKYAFDNCTGLASVPIPNCVTNIGAGAFYNCSSLSSVIIPAGVKKIEGYTFYHCSSLTSITIPDSVLQIGEHAFSGCYGLKKVNITDIASWCGITFGVIEISNPLSYAGELYLNDALVTNLIVPDCVTSINEYVFRGCTGLTSVTISNSVTEISDSAFEKCTELTNVTIGNSVTVIGDSAFEKCTELTYVTIGNSVTVIGDSAFQECTSLASITIPASVTSIGDSAFSDCSGLTSVTIGKGTEQIPENAFYNCSNLKYVCLPQELKSIRNDAFNGCSKIEVVFYAGSEAQWQEILFYNRNENLTNAKVVYNATKKTYKFETNCDAELDDITDYAVFEMPNVKNSDATLLGWYDNELLSGEPVTFPYFGDATTLYAEWTDKTGTSFDDAFSAYSNEEYTVTTTQSGQLVYFEFVPDVTKTYKIYSTGSKDTYGYLYNSNKSQIVSNDDSGDGNNFYISYTLNAGQTYYIAAKIYSGTGTFTLVIEEPVDYRIESVTLKDMSGNALTEIPTDKFLATVAFTNVSSSEDTVIILAQYTANGTFKGLMYIQTEDVPAGSTLKLSIPVDNTSGEIAKLKAFCWSSFASMTPVGNSASFPNN